MEYLLCGTRNVVVVMNGVGAIQRVFETLQLYLEKKGKSEIYWISKLHFKYIDYILKHLSNN